MSRILFIYVGSEPRIALFKLCAVFACNVCMYVYAKSCCDTCVTLLTPDDGLCCVWFVLMDSNWFKLVCNCFKAAGTCSICTFQFIKLNPSICFSSSEWFLRSC